MIYYFVIVASVIPLADVYPHPGTVVRNLAMWSLLPPRDTRPVPPEQLFDPKQIESLIKQLDADDFRTREKASRDLRQIGIGALDYLNNAAAENKPELRERAERLARKVRFESFTPGMRLEGLELTLRTERDRFQVNEPIGLQIDLANMGKSTVGFPMELQWSHSRTFGPSRMYISSSPFYHAHIHVHQLSGTQRAWRALGITHCRGKLTVPKRIDVQAGERRGYGVPVSIVGPLPPGDYEAIAYFDIRLVVEKTLERSLPSNIVRFTVE